MVECVCNLGFASDDEAEYEWCQSDQQCGCKGTVCQYHISEKDSCNICHHFHPSTTCKCRCHQE